MTLKEKKETDKILKKHHDSPNAAHYSSDGTYQRIAKHYFWIGMQKFITNYIKNCLDCARFKASNQKPAGLLQAPVQTQGIQKPSNILFILSQEKNKKNVFILKALPLDMVEPFCPENQLTRECATVLMEEFFLRFGLPRVITTTVPNLSLVCNN
ncbi:hypothetical protein AVEN_252992-1 [Araneus ventricosus]|uniref:Integrase zinc-binding domain-containing protein n=1 Tax=Araneus ventricosus TaxID=182803 RepID=A0A4Y2F1Q9_ARAVE|nr:hypothetical protein AVEN_252992-1 [Araneus ventricosus]